MTQSRRVVQVVQAVSTLEGAGFKVRRPFPVRGIIQVDPFLLLDEMGGEELAPGEAKGAPDHPHRGFETVTYVLAGRLEHKDSQGNHGLLGPGDVQWMTAGAGIVHSEMPEATFAREGGLMHAFQIWVNLPARDKLMTPRYQEVPAAGIPQAEAEGVKVRVVAGEALGARAVIDTRTPILYLHFTVQPGAGLSQPVPAGYNVMAYVFGGRATLGEPGKVVEDGQLAIFDSEGGQVRLQNAGDGPLELLLLGGVPLREPVARYGPFVMNTEAELRQAFVDHQLGRLGQIPARLSRG